MRIVSLLPAATEIVAALGFQQQLVGRSHECDYPEGIDILPVCTTSKINSDGSSSREIDRQVKESIASAASIYGIDIDMIARLKPDVIVTQDQCEVCAVSLTDVERAVSSIAGTETRIVSLNPAGLEAVYADIRRVAEALGAVISGEIIVDGIRGRMKWLSDRRRPDTERPSVACIEWTDPLMAAGNWVPELVEIAGGRDPFGKPGENAPPIDFERLQSENPDVIVFMPCGFRLERTADEATKLLANSRWRALSAAKSDRIFATDASSYFNRPGPRLMDSADMLADMIHGGKEDFSRGRWRRISA
ncbi:MAG: cobalamin-binding protein [Proteobacteria bacterium]|nr:cobalamin-binding protein [Pseudomonadota bacterium]